MGMRRLGALCIVILFSILLTSTLGCAKKAETPTLPVTPTEFNTYSRYGCSFEYPKQMSLTEEGHPVFGGEANESSGSLYGRRDNSDHEILMVSWFKVEEGASVLESSLAGLREGMKQDQRYTELVTGDIIESESCGHRMLYQTLTFKYNGDQVYEVTGCWYCDASQRFYQLGVMYSEQDVKPLFQKYIDSFVCHREG